MFRDIATIISEKCINTQNNRPYTVLFLQFKKFDNNMKKNNMKKNRWG